MPLPGDRSPTTPRITRPRFIPRKGAAACLCVVTLLGTSLVLGPSDPAAGRGDTWNGRSERGAADWTQILTQPVVAEYLSSTEPPAHTLVVPVEPAQTRAGPEPPMTIRFVARGTLIEGDAEEPTTPDPGRGGPDPVEPGQEDVERQRFNLFNARTGFVFQIDMSQDVVRELNRAALAAGVNVGTEGVDNPEEAERGTPPSRRSSGIAPAARSDGFDNRRIYAPTTTWPWRTIAHFSNNCTGTLIGPRHLITAAHCINTYGTYNFFAITVRPGRDDTTWVAQSTIFPDPEMNANDAWYLTPTEWSEGTNTPSQQWDVGLIVVPDDLGNTTMPSGQRLGWMGYVAVTADTLKTKSLYNRGYPVCGGTRPDTPVGCQPRRLYGDPSACSLGSFINPIKPGGWNRNFYTSCDTSGGHSGSPVYGYFFDTGLGKTVPAVVADHHWSACDRGGTVPACTESDDTPSLHRRITPTVLGWINWLRLTYP